MIRSERLELLPSRAEDLDELHALLNEPAVRRYLLDDDVTPREGVAAMLESSRESFESSGYGLWMIHTTDGEFIGVCGLREPEWERGQVELLYALYPAYWGRGFATEAATTVLSYAFNELQLERVVGAFDVPNTASGRVLKRLGMTFDREGRLDGSPTRFYSLEAGKWT